MNRPPATDTQELASALRLGVTRLARILRQQSDVGLTPTQLAALATLDRSGPMPIGTLAEVEQIGAPTATKIVDKLHAAGLVDRSADPDDRRVSRLSVSAAGRELLAATRARRTAWLTTRLADLSPADRSVLAEAVNILERLTAPPEPEPEPLPAP